MAQQGTNGVGFNFTGLWDSATRYYPYDVVTYSGSTYVTISGSLSTPPDQGLSWRLMAQLGAAGQDGAAGSQGPEGPEGATGAQGPAGPQGQIGPIGATGPQGPSGPIGLQGSQSNPGPQGPTGDNGVGFNFRRGR